MRREDLRTGLRVGVPEWPGGPEVIGLVEGLDFTMPDGPFLVTVINPVGHEPPITVNAEDVHPL